MGRIDEADPGTCPFGAPAYRRSPPPGGAGSSAAASRPPTVAIRGRAPRACGRAGRGLKRSAFAYLWAVKSSRNPDRDA